MPEGTTTVDGVGALPPGSTGRRAAASSPGAQAAVQPDAPAVTIGASGDGDTTRAAWRRAALWFAAGFIALIALYFDTVLDLWDGWGRTGTFAHGYIIFPVSGWLVWRLRKRLAVAVPKAQPLALVPLVGCGLLWLAGHSAGVHAPEQYALVAMVPCLVWAVFGNDVTRRILYPLAFLFFAVPAGDFLMPTLMDHTADFTVAALRLSGVPVFREGNYFTIPSGNWSVVEACSGLRYLIASITLGFLFAYLNYRSAGRRAAFIVASILVPIVANWLRAYMIVMIAHLSSNALATGVDHLVYGWLFFGLVMMALFWVGNFWRDDDADDLAAPAIAPPPPAVDPRRTRAIGGVAAAFIVLAAPWPALANRLEALANEPHPVAIDVADVTGWQGGAPAFTAFVPRYLRARTVQNEAFTAGGRNVALFIGYYSGQLTNGALVTYDNDVVVVTDKVWGRLAQRRKQVAGGLDVVEGEVRGGIADGAERLLTWRWYWINGRLTTSDYVAKAWNALDKLTGRGDDSAVIVVSTPMRGPGDADAAATLEAFVAAARPRIEARLAAVHAEARR